MKVELFSDRACVCEMISHCLKSRSRFMLWYRLDGSLKLCSTLDDIVDFLCSCKLGDIFYIQYRVNKQVREEYFMVDTDTLIPISYELYLALSDKF